MNLNIFRLLFVCLVQVTAVLGKRTLSATSLVTCMENSQISPTYFNVTFNPDDGSLRYSLDLTTEISGKVEAYVSVYAYGFPIISKSVDLCSLGWKQFCPIFPGNMQVDSIEYISPKLTADIPNIAYYVPDIDAVVKVVVRNKNTGETLSCLQSNFSNGKTVAQTGAKWATAIVAGLGLLIAAIMSSFGNSNAATHISANAVSLFLYFQAVVIVCMQHVERVPPIASAWAENLAWSMGLIRVKFMQDIFRWFVQSTGGSPTLYFKDNSKQILVQRALDHLNNIHSYAANLGKRSLSFSLNSNKNLIVLRGIKRIGYNSHIEPTSIVPTGITFFVLFGYVLVAILFIIKLILDLLIRFKKINPNFMNHFRITFSEVIKGTLLRYIYIGFTQITILGFWELTQHDSGAVIVIALLCLILVLSVLGFSFYKVLTYGRLSIAQYNNPAALLYGDTKILNKYGFCYTMFTANKYWFGVVIMGYNLVKAIFIGFCQGSGKTSALVLFILDLAYTGYLIYLRPYLSKFTNIINILSSVVNTINSFLVLFFSDLFGQPELVSSIMGWIFFILNAAYSAVLLLMIVGFTALVLVSKNPDARFAPAKDDRTSFQRMSSIKQRSNEKDFGNNNELLALGVAAQDHSMNWESEMYKLSNFSSDNENKQQITPSIIDGKFSVQEKHSSDDMSTESAPAMKEKEEEQPTTLGAKLKDKLTRGLSFKSQKGTHHNNNSNETDASKKLRVSDTLRPDSNEDPKNENPLVDKRDPSGIFNKKDTRHDSMYSDAYSYGSANQPTNTKDIL